jgi:NAD(P)-dependent dehydrogenase (short-subunit alcohol dehydrogenase family)
MECPSKTHEPYDTAEGEVPGAQGTVVAGGVLITVNCVAPGYTDTDMAAAVRREVLARNVSLIPVGRLGRPDEIARVVHFLTDDDAAYMTGALIPVNGGLEM